MVIEARGRSIAHSASTRCLCLNLKMFDLNAFIIHLDISKEYCRYRFSHNFFFKHSMFLVFIDLISCFLVVFCLRENLYLRDLSDPWALFCSCLFTLFFSCISHFSTGIIKFMFEIVLCIHNFDLDSLNLCIFQVIIPLKLWETKYWYTIWKWE